MSTRTHTWDWSDRLTSVDIDGLDTGYAYLGDDSRSSTTTSAGTTTSLVERTGGLPQVVDDGTSAYLHDVTGNSAAINDTTTDATYPLTDALGSTRLSVNATGTPIGTTDWDAWGNERTSTGSSFAFGFTGQQYDPTSELVFNRARYYSPGTAQFLSRDTIQPNSGGATGYNPYQYANSNPTTFTDPSGHFVSYQDFGGGPFAYLAYIFECFLSGNCLYQLANAVADAVSSAVNEVVRGLKSAWEWTKEIIEKGWQWVGDHWPSFSSRVKSRVRTAVQSAAEWAEDQADDWSGWHTNGVCTSVGISALVLAGFEGSVCYVTDDSGNQGVSLTRASGLAFTFESVWANIKALFRDGAMGGIGFGVVLNGFFSQAPEIWDLGGLGHLTSVGIGGDFYLGATYISSKDRQGNSIKTVSAGIGIGEGVLFNSLDSYTEVRSGQELVRELKEFYQWDPSRQP